MACTINHPLIRQASVCLLVLALAFVGINIAPAAVPPAHAQYSVVGTILGLAVIAGIVYLITRDRDGVYHRYRYGSYYANRYVYTGPYYTSYQTWEGRWYRGPMPRAWYGDRACMTPSGVTPPGRCR
jgi:hypothetical protein